MDIVASRQPKRLPIQISRPRHAGKASTRSRNTATLLRNRFAPFFALQQPRFPSALRRIFQNPVPRAGSSCIALLSLGRGVNGQFTLFVDSTTAAIKGLENCLGRHRRGGGCQDLRRNGQNNSLLRHLAAHRHIMNEISVETTVPIFKEVNGNERKEWLPHEGPRMSSR